ncbi:MAG: hypothetical protein ABIQ18_47360 [Umezawaea sp.]
MTTTARRATLLVLATTAALVGTWAYSAPEHWHATFPGFGHHWLPPLGPYNHHLVKDVGALYLALLALSLAAAWRAADTFTVRLAGTAWTVFNSLHLVFHLQHLGVYEPVDQALNVITLSLVTIAGAVLLLPGGTVPKTGLQG